MRLGNFLELTASNDGVSIQSQAVGRHVLFRTAPQMGLEPTVFRLKLHNSSQDLMKFRFFMSWYRMNSARGKVIGKK